MGKFISAFTALIKANHMAVKSKVITMKNRLLIFGLLRNRKILHLSSLSSKVHAILKQAKGEHLRDQKLNKTFVDQAITYQEVADEDKDPDLAHNLVEELDFDMDSSESVIDLVKNAKNLDETDFILEDEIDHVADVFIKRFHMRMQIQKQDSFKRYQEMLNRGL